jgi:nicotinate phosphoribosyltransferase
MGTNAHELPMVIAGLHDNGEDDWLRIAQQEVLGGWWDLYGHGLSIFLPDTFGTDFFLNGLTDEELRTWKGFRQDSGDPFEEGEKYIRRYRKAGVDASEKLAIFSDGLDVQTMVQLNDHFSGELMPSYGWGTNATNDLFDNTWHGDLWYGPLSLVVKPVSANGQGLVKLSNNLAKATGRPEDVERYKRAAAYTNTDRVECVY